MDASKAVSAMLPRGSRETCVETCTPDTIAPQRVMRRSRKANGLSAWQLRLVIAFIETHLATAISVQELADLCRLSRGHFGRAFKASLGESPRAFVTGRRIALAKRLMADDRAAFSAIAGACGFADQPHFCRVFHQHEGLTPRAFRRALARTSMANLPRGATIDPTRTAFARGTDGCAQQQPERRTTRGLAGSPRPRCASPGGIAPPIPPALFRTGRGCDAAQRLRHVGGFQ